MGYEKKLSEKADMYVELIKQLGEDEGESPMLRELCQRAYSDYKAGKISEEEYNKIYAICMDYAFPR